MRFRGDLRLYWILLASLVVTACENGMKDMYQQPKYKPFTQSPLWEDGRASRPLEPGTVAYSTGAFAQSTSGRGSGTFAGTADTKEPPTYTPAALERGRERFGIYCAPCHGPVGDGNGYITERGFPHPPTYHSDRLRQAPDGYFFDVMTRGYGVMYPYADRVSPPDRWAIVAYIRALQRSQHATVEDVPDRERDRLDAPDRETGQP
jgi:mono/diheme cytochrome c family protein